LNGPQSAGEPLPASVGAGGPSADRRRTDSLARAVFALLVIASFAAFGLTQRLKHTPTALQGIYLSASFTPGARGWLGREHISFRIKSDDRVRVTVIDSQGDTVRTLTHARPLKRYRRVYLTWDGHIAGGRTAPAGAYRIRVTLLREGHEVLSPGSFQLNAPSASAGGSGR